MEHKKVFWGVLLIAFGILIILKNVGVLYFDWLSILRLWPLLLVLWGISIIPVKGYIKALLSLIAVLIAVLLLVRYDQQGYERYHWFRPFEWHRYDDRSRSGKDLQKDREETQLLEENYDSTVIRAVLNLEAAAGTFEIEDWTDKLIKFEKSGYIGDYSMTSEDINEKRIISIDLKKGFAGRNIRHGDKAQIELNRSPIWDLDFDIGAASMDMDISYFIVNKVTIDGGASSIKIKLGDRSDETNISIDAGASSISISIPQSSGCEVITSTVLSSKTLHGFDKLDRNHYQTPGFDEYQKKIFINIDAAVSSLEVTRY